MLREQGGDWVGEQLPGWLEAASRQGSGDDITMGLLWKDQSQTSATAAGTASARTLSTGSSRADAGDDGGPHGTRPKRGARRVLTLGLLLAAVAFGIGLGWLLFDDSESPSRSANVETVSPTPSIATTASPGRIWVWDGSTGLLELDRGEPTGRALEVEELRGSGGVRDIQEGFDFLWVALGRGAMLRIDPDGTTPVEELRLPSKPAGVAIAQRRVVVSADNGGVIYLIDPETLELSAVQLTDQVETEGR
jgi:hypothetical protein